MRRRPPGAAFVASRPRPSSGPADGPRRPDRPGPRQLDAGGVSHAFGGALALGYVAEPRGTVDIDVNVFLTEDLCVFKLSFGRPRDWVDLAAIADTGLDLDLDYVEEQLVALRGPAMYPQVAKLRALVRARGT